MNSYCKAALLAAVLLTAGLPGHRAEAIQLSAVYLSACRREVGVVLRVDQEEVHMLALDGSIRTHSRFDIIYFAFYPLGEAPMDRVAGNDKVDQVTVRTIFRGVPRELVRGWMVDYAEKQISFLTTEGNETVIDIDDIWDLDMATEDKTAQFPARAAIPYRFVHPYPFAHCGYGDEPAAAPGAERRVIFPQTQLGEPLLIKKELDRLEEGYARTEEYRDSKKFYAVPQLYTNETQLGISVSTGSRYGATGTRKNNFIPMLMSGLSEGPFGFQRVWVAGAAPMPYSVHEEAQTQLYYRLKADYLHFSVQYDINQALIGSSNYKWQPEDLDSNDDRWSEIFHIAGGFDYGALAFELGLTFVGYAVRHESEFFEDKVDLVKLGFTFHHRGFKSDFYLGTGTDKKPSIVELTEGNSEEEVAAAEARRAAIPEFQTRLRFFRMNLVFPGVGQNRLVYSIIYRWLDFERMEDRAGLGAFHYVGRSLTNALRHETSLNEDLTLSVFASVEAVANRFGEAGLDGEGEHTFLKGGVAIQFRL